MQGQLTLDLAPDRTDPRTCPHRADFALQGVWRCMAHDGTFVSCGVGHFGEPPMCSYEEPDNSPEAVARRLEWMMEHGKEDE